MSSREFQLMNPHKAGSDFRQLSRHSFFRKRHPSPGLCRPPSGAPLWFPTHTQCFFLWAPLLRRLGGEKDWSSKVIELISFPLLCKQLCEGHPDSAIKEGLTGKGIGQGCFIFCQARAQVASAGERPSHWELSLPGQGTRQ